MNSQLFQPFRQHTKIFTSVNLKQNLSHQGQQLISHTKVFGSLFLRTETLHTGRKLIKMQEVLKRDC